MFDFSFSGLSNLEKLNLESNNSLLRISADVCRLPKLRRIELDGCYSLVSPPVGVSKQGLSAMLKYFTDLEKDGKKNFIPVTVIGRSMAGKTSLVRSMQMSERILSNRSDDRSPLDQATKVFKVCEADFDEVSKLVFHDFGGHAIYHFAYPLSSRSRFFPMLVIDIEAFDRLAESKGSNAACEEVCFEWLSHLYLSCPQAGPPLVVLTHLDCVDTSVFEIRKQELIDVTETLRLKIIEEEEAMTPKTSQFFSMVSFCNASQPLLTKHKPLVFSVNSGKKEITDLKHVLYTVGFPLLTEIPGSWYVMMQVFESKTDSPYLTLDEIDVLFPDDTGRVMLQYLHEIGRIMWYRNRTLIACIVFHRVELLTKVVELLFDHTSKEVWEKRINSFKPFKHGDRGITAAIYRQMAGRFQDTGIMNSILLSHLIKMESKIKPELAIEVLKVFHLVCGPIQESSGSSYIVPYFSQKVITVIEGGSYIPLKVDICFNGLAIPGYVYHLLTAIYVDIHISPLNSADVGVNGACVKDVNQTIKYIFHSQSESTVSLIVLTQPENIASSWSSLLSTLECLKDQLAEVWKGAHYDTVFYCSHCSSVNRRSCPLMPTHLGLPISLFTLARNS